MFKFNNIGKKIMCMAKVLMWVAIVLYILMGISVLFINEYSYNGNVMEMPIIARIICAAIIMISGAILAWVSSLTTYGFGHLIETVDHLNDPKE